MDNKSNNQIYTLKGMLTEVYNLKGSERNIESDVDDEELKRAKAYILNEFFIKNHIAGEVVNNMTSYEKLVVSVNTRNDSVQKRIFPPKTDNSLDDKIRRIIDSINNVGEASLNREIYTTGYKRNYIISSDKKSLALGICLSGVLAIGSYLGSLNIYIIAIPEAILLFGPYCMSKLAINEKIKMEITALNKAATNTDEFLKKFNANKKYQI